MKSVLTLEDVVPRLPVLNVACNRCERRSRLRSDWLLAEHGPALSMPTLLRILAGDCPRMQAAQMSDVCGAHFPGLSALRQ
jgi:hypothetical protein